MKSYVKTALAALPLILSGFTATPAALAAGNLLYSGHASGDCKGSSGFGAQYLYFSPDYLENTSGDTQYIVCSLPAISSTAGPHPGGTWDVYITVSNLHTATTTFSCAVKVGGTVYVKTATLGPNTSQNIALTAMPMTNMFSHAMVNCALPTGARVSTIAAYQPITF